ncbi:serine/threonine-protein kinase [Kitasatospora sp. NPDC051170]|uniref:serine/threonine-protein kinase n=1 Tax=Kitasatospora sp. NPDC051170 TaxID=3364056 RepID=UPI0037BB75A6
MLGPDGPEWIGPFRVLAVLGRGGMGRVLLGVSQDGRAAAVKQVHAELAEDEGFRARFRREVEASRRVSGAYTAAVIAADPDAATPWLASEFVAGPSLGEALRTAGALPEGSVRRLAAGLAQALVDVHRAGLIHRDLKPSNVLLAADGVRVIDFGIARAAAEGQDTRLTRTGAMIGSPGYMAPEQVEGRELTPAGDVFALGATLAVAATGRPAFTGESLPRVLFNVLHAQPDVDGVPDGLRPLVLACLAKDPAARPTPQAVLAAVGRIAPSTRPWPEAVHGLLAAQEAELAVLMGAVTAMKEPVAPEPVRRPRRAALIAGASVAALAAVAGTLLATGAVSLDSLRPEPVPTPGTTPLSQVADRYRATAPTCEDARAVDTPGEFAAPAGNPPGPPSPDGHATDFCEWTSRSGDRIQIVWDVFASTPGGETGAERAKDHYEGLYLGGRTRDPGIDFAEEGFWLPAKQLGEESCVLYLRDVNLGVFVAVKGGTYPRGHCEEMTKGLGESAVQVAATVSRDGHAPAPAPTPETTGAP